MKMFPNNSGSVVGERPDNVIKKIEMANFTKAVSGAMERRQGTMAGEVLRHRYELGETNPVISEMLGIDQDEVQKIINEFDSDLLMESNRKAQRKRKRR